MKCPRCEQEKPLTFKIWSRDLKPELHCEDCGQAAFDLPLGSFGTIQVQRIATALSDDLLASSRLKLRDIANADEESIYESSVDMHAPHMYVDSIVERMGQSTQPEEGDIMPTFKQELTSLKRRVLQAAKDKEREAKELHEFIQQMDAMGDKIDMDTLGTMEEEAKAQNNVNYAAEVKEYLTSLGKKHYTTNQVMQAISNKTGQPVEKIYQAVYSAIRYQHEHGHISAHWKKQQEKGDRGV